MIVTFTANPSLDRTATLDRPLTRGEVHRVEAVTVEGAGKGVNVARVIAAAGVDVHAVLPFTDEGFQARLLADRTPGMTVVAPAGPSHHARTNTTITEPDGTTTKLNSPGDHVDGSALLRMSEALVAQARAASARSTCAAGASQSHAGHSVRAGAACRAVSRAMTGVAMSGMSPTSSKLASWPCAATIRSRAARNTGRAASSSCS